LYTTSYNNAERVNVVLMLQTTHLI